MMSIGSNSVKLIFFLSIWNCVNCRTDWKSTTIENYPYHVTILRNGEFLCNAAIISRAFAVTSGSCADELEQRDGNAPYRTTDSVISGSSTYQSGGTRHDILYVTTFPKFNATTLENDIGLVMVSPPFEFSEPLKLPDKDGGDFFKNRGAVVTAWSEGLRRRRIPIFHRLRVRLGNGGNNCKKSKNLAQHMVCVQDNDERCLDEGGAPLVVNGTILYGIMSKPCGGPRVYTKLAPFAQGIRGIISPYMEIPSGSYEDDE